MKKGILVVIATVLVIVAIAMTAILIIGILKLRSNEEGQFDYSGNVTQVTSYNSIVTIDGETTRHQYGTGLFFEDGTCLRFIGAHDFEEGKVYRITYEATEDPTWNRIVEDQEE